MRFWITGRRTGKTTMALKWMKVKKMQGLNPVLIVHSVQEADRLYESTKNIRGESPFETWQIIAHHQLRSGVLSSKRDIVFAVDNIDLVLPALLGGEVEFVTGTGLVG